MAMVEEVKEEATEIKLQRSPWAAAGTNANANETQTNPRAARITYWWLCIATSYQAFQLCLPVAE